MRCPTRFNSWVFIILHDIPMAVKCDLFLYADDTCLVFQSKNGKDTEKQLNEYFANICDWFVDNKLIIHFGEDKINLAKFVLMKTSFVFVFRRRLQDVLIKTNMFALALRLQKTSWSRPIYSSWLYVFKTSSRRLAKTSSRHLQDVLQGCLQDVLKTYHQVKLFA